MAIKKEKNFLELSNEISKMESELRALKHKRDHNPASAYIQPVIDCDLGLSSDADRLVYELSERDHPLNRREIKEIFEFSGFEYEDKHIDESRPDSEEGCIEEAARYADARDFGRDGGCE